MIGYVTLGTNDMARGVAFYDALVAEMGGKRMMEEEGMFVAWNVEPEKPGLALTKPFDGQSATVGNGVMVALMVESKEQVDALHQKAMELGGSDEGAPGPRGEGFYAGYFRDPDGNKLNFFCTPQ
ncbi:MAG: VOC family protein [Pseudomonadota bacterium]